MSPWGGADGPQPDTRLSCGVSVYSPAFAGTKLYCLVTEAHRCEKLAQRFYVVVPGRDSKPRLLVASATLYRDATTPPQLEMHGLEIIFTFTVHHFSRFVHQLWTEYIRA